MTDSPSAERDRNGLEILHRDECVKLLTGSSFGRLAVTVGALPAIFPVNYLVEGDRILVRTGEGTKLDAAMRDAVVAFEVDSVDALEHGGWSVCVTGRSSKIRDELELARIAELPLPRWAPDGMSHVMAVSLDLISGRRISRP
jgi:nitroimidazol reductase NimA-like FMN-containing flavoprotein (pyridoxamine 5'-phosphate oxidase superfamily)